MHSQLIGQRLISRVVQHFRTHTHTHSTVLRSCATCNTAVCGSEITNRARCNSLVCSFEIASWASCGSEMCVCQSPILVAAAMCSCRSQGRYQLGEGWKPFAQHWGLGHGDHLQLSRRLVSSGCIWLDVQFVREDQAQAAAGMPKCRQILS